MDEMDPHVQAGVYGTPKINPDEQRRYLGTFRERVYAAQTVATFGDPTYMPVWEEQFAAHPDATLYLNGHMEQEDLNKYMKLATQAGIGFTLKTSDEYKVDPDRVAAELVAKEAVNVDVIDVTKMLKELDEPVQAAPEKKGFFKRLFG